MANALSVLKETDNELAAMQSWAVTLHNLKGAFQPDKITKLTRKINTQGKKLEWRYVNNLESLGCEKKIVDKLSKCVSSARAAAQEIQTEMEKIENSQNPRKGILNLFIRKKSTFKGGWSTPKNVSEVTKLVAMLLEDLKEARLLCLYLKDKVTGERHLA